MLCNTDATTRGIVTRHVPMLELVTYSFVTRQVPMDKMGTYSFGYTSVTQGQIGQLPTLLEKYKTNVDFDKSARQSA